ncbi:putative transcription factor Homeodomain-TALE-KNOX family [Medicago truncatula]|uniref:Putative transcription factor Homeodomain-TALE-KNOX family n=1 Tax=Medicago truncatula TaxID=3880 RepID=A0A396JFC2_MEDTR|nr:putative transcription factor Homeodomain-TALE-KNOX family [Medicago truncatula]
MAYQNQHLSQELPIQHFTDQTNNNNNNSFRSILPDSPDPNSKPDSDPNNQLQTTPNWLNNAILRTHYTDNNNNNNNNDDVTNNVNNDSDGNGASNFLNLQQTSDTVQTTGQWLARSILHRQHGEVIDNVTMASEVEHELANMKNDGDSDGLGGKSEVAVVGDGGLVNWQMGRWKAEIMAHPLYEQLLSAHVACLRIATPVDQLPRIDAQLAQSQNVVAKYSAFGQNIGAGVDDKELDHFMSHYVLLLCSFKEQLQQHVRVHAMEAVMACWEIEQSLQSLTGVSPGEGTGATMSDDEDEQVDSDANLFDGSFDGGADNMGFGPLIPTENERSLMERVRQELKHELKHGYKEKIVDIREEILRKRRAGKLPGDTTSVLKAWWQSHSKWPYPTEEDKARLVQETGLQLKQINNWFINQRKRNWHSNPSTSTVLKSKRKRET